MTYIERLEYLQSRIIQLKLYFSSTDLPKASAKKLLAHIKAMEAEIKYTEDELCEEAKRFLNKVNSKRNKSVINTKTNERE